MTTKRLVSTDGYAPEVPKYVDIPSADPETLVLILRDYLQNNHGTRTTANLAIRHLVRKLHIETTFEELDPEPWEMLVPSEEDSDSGKVKLERFEVRKDGADFKPRYGYAQDQTLYTPGPTEMGWYPDPDGSGKERWWLGTMWSENYRDPEKKK